MEPVSLVLGLVLLALAAGTVWWMRAVRADLGVMRETPTTRAADVAKLPPGTQVHDDLRAFARWLTGNDGGQRQPAQSGQSGHAAAG